MTDIAYVMVAAILFETTVMAVTKVTGYALRHDKTIDMETRLWLDYLLLVAAALAAIATRCV